VRAQLAGLLGKPQRDVHGDTGPRAWSPTPASAFCTPPVSEHPHPESSLSLSFLKGQPRPGGRAGPRRGLLGPCVTILLFNSSRRSLVLVKQFRPAVYAGEVERRFPGSLTAVDQDGPRELQAALPGSAGVTFELCAGLLDQPGLSLEEVACKEAWEECGYRLAPSDLRRVATYKSGVGLTGSSQTMFYAEVTDAQRAGPGGGLAEEGELIEVVHLPLDGAQAFADDPDVPKTLGVIFGISWFLSCVAPGLSPH
uniref:Uridine diphosphate glucose pyrophosphatase NUDT14 n=1 Tax=Equus caballus TaxID=9796 RepID=A0A9L0SW05_HORSE